MKSYKFWFDSWVRGGAGGVYGDLLSDAMRGDAGAIAGSIGGPFGGLAGDVGKLATSPLRREFFDQYGRPSSTTFAGEAFGIAKRHLPNTFYTKLAMDRLLWDKLQVLLDPNYRASFRRSAEAASRQGRGGFWWNEGDSFPNQAPQLSTALGR